MMALKTYLQTSKKIERCHKQRDSRLHVQVTEGVNLKTTVLLGEYGYFLVKHRLKLYVISYI